MSAVDVPSLLAIETATDACSVAVAHRDRMVRDHRVAPRRHAELLLEMIEGALREAQVALGDLGAIAFGRGPGSFTGVRIAASVAQGLAFGVSLPVVPVSSLHALAEAVERPAGAGVLVALDARMNEVYWGAFAPDAAGGLVPVGEERVCAPEAVATGVPAPGAGEWIGAGPGWPVHGEPLARALGAAAPSVVLGEALPDAVAVARLGRRILAAGGQIEAARAVPTYLRNQVTR